MPLYSITHMVWIICTFVHLPFIIVLFWMQGCKIFTEAKMKYQGLNRKTSYDLRKKAR